MNDLYSLGLIYYSINNIEFIIIGFLLLLGSIICINMYYANKNTSFFKFFSFINFIDFFKDFINFSFLRKQDLNNQSKKNYFLKILKKIN